MTGGNVDAFFTDSENQKLAWECPADLGYDIAPSPIIEAGNFIYIPTSSGMVVAINKKTHLVAWKHKVSNALINSITPVGKRRLLVSVLDGQVVCLMING
jgi:outer membrane protein assembly factor BamB